MRNSDEPPSLTIEDMKKTFGESLEECHQAFENLKKEIEKAIIELLQWLKVYEKEGRKNEKETQQRKRD